MCSGRIAASTLRPRPALGGQRPHEHQTPGSGPTTGPSGLPGCLQGSNAVLLALFCGICVSDYDAAAAWYVRLLCAEIERPARSGPVEWGEVVEVGEILRSGLGSSHAAAEHVLGPAPPLWKSPWRRTGGGRRSAATRQSVVICRRAGEPQLMHALPAEHSSPHVRTAGRWTPTQNARSRMALEIRRETGERTVGSPASLGSAASARSRCATG